jgi:DNA-binding transcriptional ArsR family regulator
MGDDRCELLCLDLSLAEAVRATVPASADIERAASRARALSDPTRLAVATALAHGGELCGCDLAWVLGRAQNLVSHHLKTLREAGLVEGRRDGKTVFFRVTDEGLELLRHVMGEEVPA